MLTTGLGLCLLPHLGHAPAREPVPVRECADADGYDCRGGGEARA